MLGFNFLEPEVSCRVSNMPLKDTMLSLKNQAQSSSASSNLRQTLACDILHENVQFQYIVSGTLPHAKQKHQFRSVHYYHL
jgi:hypothetical protein